MELRSTSRIGQAEQRRGEEKRSKGKAKQIRVKKCNGTARRCVALISGGNAGCCNEAFCNGSGAMRSEAQGMDQQRRRPEKKGIAKESPRRASKDDEQQRMSTEWMRFGPQRKCEERQGIVWVLIRNGFESLGVAWKRHAKEEHS